MVHFILGVLMLLAPLGACSPGAQGDPRPFAGSAEEFRSRSLRAGMTCPLSYVRDKVRLEGSARVLDPPDSMEMVLTLYVQNDIEKLSVSYEFKGTIAVDSTEPQTLYAVDRPMYVIEPAAGLTWRDLFFTETLEVDFPMSRVEGAGEEEE